MVSATGYSQQLSEVVAVLFRFCTFLGVSLTPRMYSFRKLVVWLILAVVVLAAVLPVAPGLFWTFLVPLLLFSFRAAVAAEHEPECIFAPQDAFVPLLPSRAPPVA